MGPRGHVGDQIRRENGPSLALRQHVNVRRAHRRVLAVLWGVLRLESAGRVRSVERSGRVHRQVLAPDADQRAAVVHRGPLRPPPQSRREVPRHREAQDHRRHAADVPRLVTLRRLGARLPSAQRQGEVVREVPGAAGRPPQGSAARLRALPPAPLALPAAGRLRRQGLRVPGVRLRRGPAGGACQERDLCGLLPARDARLHGHLPRGRQGAVQLPGLRRVGGQ
mmetsp:Transcript_44267/g.125018  ORF Transcript_44267/g.125018 Transcript_44267/m.125018 type:complete len:224 (+) Transcript_44267:607-1278(+)